MLLKYKEEECKELGIDFDGVINEWDTSYYLNMVEKRDYQVCKSPE